MEYSVKAYPLKSEDGFIQKGCDLVPDWVQSSDAIVDYDGVSELLTSWDYIIDDSGEFNGWGEVWSNADGELIAVVEN